MWRRKATGVAALVLGAILIIAGLVDHAVIASKAALCQSPIGQIGGAIDTTVAHDCGLVNDLESAVGWLIAVGILVVILGVVVTRNSRTLPQTAAAAASWSGAPPAPWSAGPPAPWSAGPPSPGPAAPPAPWAGGPPPSGPAVPAGPWSAGPPPPGPAAPTAPRPAGPPPPGPAAPAAPWSGQPAAPPVSLPAPPASPGPAAAPAPSPPSAPADRPWWNQA
jgi:hypothetical protein